MAGGMSMARGVNEKPGMNISWSEVLFTIAMNLCVIVVLMLIGFGLWSWLS